MCLIVGVCVYMCVGVCARVHVVSICGSISLYVWDSKHAFDYVFVCMYVTMCMRASKYEYKYMFVYLCVCECVCVCVCTRAIMYACAWVCVHMFVVVSVFIALYVCACEHAHVCTHDCAHNVCAHVCAGKPTLIECVQHMCVSACVRTCVYTHACVCASLREWIFNCHQYAPLTHHAQTHTHMCACLLAEAVQSMALALHFETDVADDIHGGDGPVWRLACSVSL